MIREAVWLRDAEPSDAAAIAALWHVAWHVSHAPLSPPQVTANRVPDWFIGRAIEFVPRACVAERAGVVVGFVTWKAEELSQLFVATEEYGSGAALALLVQAETAMMGQGVRKGFLACRAGNERAARFYEKHGWNRTGVFMQELRGTDGPHNVETWRLVKCLAIIPMPPLGPSL